MTGKATVIFPGFQGFPGAVGTLVIVAGRPVEHLLCKQFRAGAAPHLHHVHVMYLLNVQYTVHNLPENYQAW